MALWSSKGGSGLSTVAAAVAALSARVGSTLLVDLAGDQAALCGLAADPELGMRDWMAGPCGPSSGALDRLACSVAPGLTLLAAGGGGDGGADPAAPGSPVDALAARRETVVIDAGLALCGPAARLVEQADHSVLVIRPCYLALRRAVARADLVTASTGVVVLGEEHRALSVDDVARVLGLPVLAVVPADRAVARSVDAGTLVTRPPRCLSRALEPVVSLLTASLAAGDAA